MAIINRKVNQNLNPIMDNPMIIMHLPQLFNMADYLHMDYKLVFQNHIIVWDMGV